MSIELLEVNRKKLHREGIRFDSKRIFIRSEILENHFTFQDETNFKINVAVGYDNDDTSKKAVVVLWLGNEVSEHTYNAKKIGKQITIYCKPVVDSIFLHAPLKQSKSYFIPKYEWRENEEFGEYCLFYLKNAKEFN